MSAISPSYSKAIAAAIRAEFARRGLKQSNLASVIERSRPTAASRWHGETPYNAVELDLVASFLGLSPYDLNDSAALGDRFSGQQKVAPEAARITPTRIDTWAQPSRARKRKTA